MPFSALSPFVIDKAKRKAGISMLIRPIKKRVKYFCLGTALNAFRATGKAQIHEMLMRRHASSTGLKPTKPFLISM